MAYTRDKNTCARTLAENVGGTYTRKGAYMWDTTVCNSFQVLRERGERAWSPLFEHALNCGGIPALWTIDLCLYICDVKTDAQCYVSAPSHLYCSNKYSVRYEILIMLS